MIVPGTSQSQLFLHCALFGGIPAWLAVGKQTTIRNLTWRMEDHIGFRFPTNRIRVCSHMTVSVSKLSIISSTVTSRSCMSCLRLCSLVHQTTAWTPPPKLSIGGSQDTLWITPELMSHDLVCLIKYLTPTFK